MKRGCRFRRSATIAGAVVAFAVGCGGDELSGDLLLRADRVFDGERVINGGAVLITGGRVTAIGVSEDLDVKAARTVELDDATILPGLIDLHVHAENLAPELILASGVTTIRDVGAPISSLAPRSAQPGSLRVLSAGPIITVPAGYPIPVHGPAVAFPVSGEAEAEAAVKRFAAQGAAVIKIAVERGGQSRWPTLHVTEIRAIVSAAHALDLRVTAHVTSVEDAQVAFEGGVDELAHMPCFGRDPRLMRELAARSVEIVGTLHVRENRSCPDLLANARAFVDAGGSLLYGSDMGNPGIPLGLDPEELRLIGAAGLSATDALQAATSRAGRLLGEEKLGRLVPGAPADVLVVKGNPFRDLDRLRDVSLVIAGGEIAVEGGRLTGAK